MTWWRSWEHSLAMMVSRNQRNSLGIWQTKMTMAYFTNVKFNNNTYIMLLVENDGTGREYGDGQRDRENPRGEPPCLDRALAGGSTRGFPYPHIINAINYSSCLYIRCKHLFFSLPSICPFNHVRKTRLMSLSDVITPCVSTYSKN